MKLKELKDFQDEVARLPHYGYKNWQEMLIALSQKNDVDLLFDRAFQAAELYAEYMAIEFAEFIDKNCDLNVEGGYGYKNKTYSPQELYKIFREENK